MVDEDAQRFASGLLALAEYYGKPMSDGVIALYWQGLQDMDIASVEAAIGRHMRNPDNGQFMPKVADLRRMVVGRTADVAAEAWAKVDRAIRTVGTYRSVVFDDPLIHRVVQDMGGWVRIGTKGEEEWPFVAKEFENRYRGYAMRSERPDYPPLLVGITQADAEQRGFRADPPTLIGDKQNAQLVLTGGTTAQVLQITRASA